MLPIDPQLTANRRNPVCETAEKAKSLLTFFCTSAPTDATTIDNIPDPSIIPDHISFCVINA
jgi:hypothetical protein